MPTRRYLTFTLATAKQCRLQAGPCREKKREPRFQKGSTLVSFASTAGRGGEEEGLPVGHIRFCIRLPLSLHPRQGLDSPNLSSAQRLNLSEKGRLLSGNS
ncbi:hypothetical protein CEXT_506151 [Caerostris extrusa]|uniref:Uncharacterized protein n=1 Tax=Caerostris extrusa TaxID=172846 RepID=A0AAV4XEN2_CAEEX|nr:hypothetical protein CEXT_506151 [Caerostris extrusa]